MANLPIRSIWTRSVPLNEFSSIEWNPDRMAGGSGQTYISVPPALVDKTLRFIGSTRGSDDQPLPATIEARVIGDPTVTGPLEFKTKSGGRMRIANQNRQATPEKRHPAWREERGFPKADDDIADRDAARAFFPDALHVYIVLTRDGDYYAGFTTGTDYPAAWPDYEPLKALFSARGGGDVIDISEHVVDEDVGWTLDRIFGAWERGKGALLYGPPGTGKTYVLGNLRRLLLDGGSVTLRLDTGDHDNPFRVVGSKSPLPKPVATEWITFHQSYSYEDFVIGLRPRPSDGGGFALQPRLGRLLDRLYELTSGDFETKSVVFFVDEINRGNAARIFGELMTFLDMEYRATMSDGGANPLALPIPLSSLDREGDAQTEKVRRSNGEDVRLPVPWYFPRHVYFVATMNSVDRGAIPIDSALARRFERVALRPDLEVLARHLGIDWATLVERAQVVRGGADRNAWKTMTAEETAILLLDRLNAVIATALGDDFELGHSLLWNVGNVSTDDRWRALSACWDDDVFPQLQERFLGRSDALVEALKVGDAPEGEPYAFTRRFLLGEVDPPDEGTLRPVRLAKEETPVQRSTLRWLAL